MSWYKLCIFSSYMNTRMCVYITMDSDEMMMRKQHELDLGVPRKKKLRRRKGRTKSKKGEQEIRTLFFLSSF